MADFTIKRNDTRPFLVAGLSAGGSAYDLTGATVKLIMKAEGAPNPKVDTAASIVNAAQGIVQYQWLETDTDTEGIFQCEWEVTDAGGKVLTFPNGHAGPEYFTVEVKEDLG